MTRIPTGTTDQGFYFVGLDSLDYSTPKTGLTFTEVYRSRNGAAEAAMTTPTITEIDVTNMPGVYFLLCDEDMTITSGNVEEEMAYRITAAGMVPVVKVISLFDPYAHVYEGAENMRDFMRLARAVLVGEAAGMGTTTATFRDAADSKDRVTATVTADGDRTAVTVDPT